ncbi:uncharacterized protein K02A2.6-like [Haliotis rubra]|uniref:uncharacterized protein K02A2.6-like n=1 Tax=Haliotis rubra TaxID=36100 RepID=UPI001EE581AB|nr:uncharacterized protein K02A2.6-like [Haliotis rubra]
MGDELYKLAHDLFAPVKVSTLKSEDIIEKLTQHLNPPPSIIIARCNFNRLSQRPDETVNEYVAKLRRIAEDCSYGENLNMWLRDRFVAGVHSEVIRRQLLQEDAKMTFDKAYQLAVGMETATKEAKSLQQGQGHAVNKMIHNKGNKGRGFKRDQMDKKPVDGTGPALLGRDWLQHMMSWQHMFTNSIANSSQKEDVTEILNEYQEVFDEGLGHLKDFKVRLSVQDNAVPVFCKVRNVPLALRQKVDAEIDRMESEDIIRKVRFSQWATPVVPVVKPSGEVRLCGDYKSTVNLFSKTDIHPIPKVDELLANLSGGEEFTKLDLRHAYLQLELDEPSKGLTTINTTKGLYQFNRLPYGVSAAPAVFQRTIEMVLKGLIGLVIFMDDICITGRTHTEHKRNLKAVLKALRSAGLKLRLDKCKFFRSKVEFLGFTVDKDGIHPTPSKVSAIKDAPAPKEVNELRSYLGMLNHYSEFLPNMATKCAPLYDLLKKTATWKWTQVEQQAFEVSKSDLTSDSLLIHYDSDKEIVVSCDASPYGIGCVLQHRTEEGEKPVAFASRKLNSAEKNYSQLEKEALALIFVVTKFRQYLLGRQFTLITDHKPLIHLFSPSKETPVMAASRIKRSSLKLATFQYNIEYRTSKQNANADLLSRLPLSLMEDSTESDTELVLLLSQVDEDLPITAQAVARATDNDKLLHQVQQLTLEGWPEEPDHVSQELKPFYQRRLELTVEQGVVMWGTRVLIPTIYREALLNELHNEHSGMVHMKSVVRGIIWWPYLDRDIENLVRGCLDCQEEANHPVSVVPTPWKWPSSPWTRLHIDFAGPFIGHSFLVIVDAHSKWLEIYQMRSTTATITIKHLRRLFATFGLPLHIVSDNGTQFTCQEFQTFLRRNKIRHTTTAPAHPATNGQAERAVASFKQAMKKMKNQDGDIGDKLLRFLFSYRTTPHSSTGKTPAELLMKRTLRTRLSALRPAMENDMSVKEDPHDNAPRYFDVGQAVFVRNYGVYGARWLIGTIVERLGDRNYQVSVGSQVWKRHVDQIRSRDITTGCRLPLDPFIPHIPDHDISQRGRSESMLSSNQPKQAESNLAPPLTVVQGKSLTAPCGKPAATPAAVEEPRRNPPRDRRRPARFSDV